MTVLKSEDDKCHNLHIYIPTFMGIKALFAFQVAFHIQDNHLVCQIGQRGASDTDKILLRI